MNGKVCLTVEYVEGHETPPRCFVRLTCTTTGTEYNGTIEGTSGCIDDVPPHSSYIIAATDADAVGEINYLVAVRGSSLIYVPSYAVPPSTTFTTPSATPTG